MTLATISGRVVQDTDGDFTERLGHGFEGGLGGQRVQLVNSFGHVVCTVTTDHAGNYHFGGIWPGAYRVVFPTAVGDLRLAPKDVGPDGEDSDANQASGSTDFIHVGFFQRIGNVDAVYGSYGPTGNGRVDGSDAGQHMGVGFVDGQGDRITDGNDTIYGNGGNDDIRAGGGNDLVYGGRDNDYIEGNAGNDTIYGDEGHDNLRGGEGNDLIFGGHDNDYIEGNAGNDTIHGDAGDDNLRGNEGDDQIFGGTGNDYAAGGTGHDLLEGGDGNDTLHGEDGNDRLHGQEGHDHLNGGAGNDFITGDGGNDYIVTGSGHDTVYGGAGNDVIDDAHGYDSTHNGNLVYGDAGNDTIWGSAVGDTLFGGDDNDFINGESGDDHINGGNGADTLRGDGGNDTFYVRSAAEGRGDHISGGNGPDQHRDHDILDLRGAGAVTIAATADLSDAGAQMGTVTFADGSVLNFSQIEQILRDGDGRVDGSDAGQHMGVGFADAQGDRITDGNDTIFGNGGHDNIRAGGGNDLVYGGRDNDYIEGNAGNDTIYGDEGHDNLRGGEGNDLIFGGHDNDYIEGNAGNDTIHGDAGDDNLRGNEGDDQIFGGTGNDYAAGGTGHDLLEGGDGNDTLHGEDGNDRLHGQEGHDHLNGGAGNDFITGDGGNDYIVTGSGHDTVYGGAGNDVIDDAHGYDSTHNGNLVYGDAGNDTIWGSAVGDTLFGGDDNDFINGESGDDHIYGGTGSDTLRGDGGNDTFYVRSAAEGAGDHISGGNGSHDHDVLDLRGAGNVQIHQQRDWHDAGATRGTVTFADGSQLRFEGIERIVTDPLDVAPVAVNDSASVDEDSSVTIDVLANDSDPNGDPLRVTAASADNGSVTINANGTITYVPNPDYNGDDTIRYTVSDPQGNTAVGTVAVVVEAVEDAPVAQDDTAEVDANDSVVIDVLANDSDADGDVLFVTGASAENGSVTVNDDGTLTYTPDAGFSGDDTITYTVSDPQGNTDEGSVAVTVDAVADGVVNGSDSDDFINIGFTDADGDMVDGDDGLNDVIDAGAGNDTVEAGFGNDLVNGGDGDDLLDGGEGSDTLNGGAGDDTFLQSGGGDVIDGGDGYDSYIATGNGSTAVLVSNEGNSIAELFPEGVAFFEGPASSVDQLSSIERIVATENSELDKIAFGDSIGASEISTAISGLSDDAVGFFNDGNQDINFGPGEAYRLSDILNGTAPDDETPAVGPVGQFVIFGNDESGQIGGVSFEGFEEIFFRVEDDSYESMMRSAAYEEGLAQTEEEDEDIPVFDI